MANGAGMMCAPGGTAAAHRLSGTQEAGWTRFSTHFPTLVAHDAGSNTWNVVPERDYEHL
ncbi:hypothetical protein GCM10007164_21960 [Luteimonas padinae]|nr:hypothetical protein GCM10007164_21960 [Luteimonas padinae]